MLRVAATRYRLGILEGDFGRPRSRDGGNGEIVIAGIPAKKDVEDLRQGCRSRDPEKLGLKPRVSMGSVQISGCPRSCAASKRVGRSRAGRLGLCPPPLGGVCGNVGSLGCSGRGAPCASESGGGGTYIGVTGDCSVGTAGSATGDGGGANVGGANVPPGGASGKRIGG